jgi:hypothetical protein
MAAFATLGVLVSPFSLDYHYTLLLLPIAVLLAARHQRPWPPAATVLLMIAVALLALDLPFRGHLLLPHPALALLGYPKLYGGSLLWALCLWQMGTIRSAR